MAIIFTLAGFQAQFPIHNYLSPFTSYISFEEFRFDLARVTLMFNPPSPMQNPISSKKDCFFLGNFISTATIKDSNLLFVVASRANLNLFRI